MTAQRATSRSEGVLLLHAVLPFQPDDRLCCCDQPRLELEAFYAE